MREQGSSRHFFSLAPLVPSVAATRTLVGSDGDVAFAAFALVVSSSQTNLMVLGRGNHGQSATRN